MPQEKFSYRNYFRPTPKNIEQLLLAFKAVIGTAAITTYAMSSEKLGFWLLIGGAALDAIAKFFGRVAEEVKVEKAPEVTDPVIVTPEEA